jgi:hypothetical protein
MKKKMKIGYKVFIGNEVVFRTNDLKNALNTISKIFNDGHTDVYLYGGKFGYWWK